MSTVFIPLDRPGAIVRGLWRFLAAAIPGGIAAFLARRMDWEQFWRDQRLVGICLAFVLVTIALPALSLALSGIRWWIAAASPGLGVALSDRELVVLGGPFGSKTLDRPRLQVKLDGDLSLDAWVQLPEDTVGVGVFHPSTRGDLLDAIRPLLGSRSAEFTQAMRDQLRDAPPPNKSAC